jgi:hypothetical protein
MKMMAPFSPNTFFLDNYLKTATNFGRAGIAIRMPQRLIIVLQN